MVPHTILQLFHNNRDLHIPHPPAPPMGVPLCRSRRPLRAKARCRPKRSLSRDCGAQAASHRRRLRLGRYKTAFTFAHDPRILVSHVHQVGLLGASSGWLGLSASLFRPRLANRTLALVLRLLGLSACGPAPQVFLWLGAFAAAVSRAWRSLRESSAHPRLIHCRRAPPVA